MKPFRIDIKTNCVVNVDVLKAQAAANAHLPRIEPVQLTQFHGRRLAVVGGSPDVAQDLDELRHWDGDIWAINYTAQWLHERGVRATLFSLDPMPMAVQVKTPEALLSTCCDPKSVQEFIDRGGQVRMFDLCETHEGGITGGVTSVTRAPSLSLALGYRDVSIFGCSGSYESPQMSDGFYGIRDHVDRNDNDANPEEMLMIRAGGVDYCTTPGLLVQCEQLAALFLAFPDVYRNRSRGLVKAMVEHQDTWEVVAVSGSMKEHLEAVNGPSGLYEHHYVRAA